MVCLPVRGDNRRALALGVSPVQLENRLSVKTLHITRISVLMLANSADHDVHVDNEGLIYGDVNYFFHAHDPFRRLARENYP